MSILCRHLFNGRGTLGRLTPNDFWWLSTNANKSRWLLHALSTAYNQPKKYTTPPTIHVHHVLNSLPKITTSKKEAAETSPGPLQRLLWKILGRAEVFRLGLTPVNRRDEASRSVCSKEIQIGNSM